MASLASVSLGFARCVAAGQTFVHITKNRTSFSTSCRYDPSKYAHVDKLPDRDMEAGYNDIQKEELRSKRIAREEDAR